MIEKAYEAIKNASIAKVVGYLYGGIITLFALGALIVTCSVHFILSSLALLITGGATLYWSRKIGEK
jgi:ribose/xylose/arabinose/galactoside ABC-type transport system permease subunit